MPTVPNTTSLASPVDMNSLDTVKKASSTLDKDGFLKLFVEQLQHQDPSAPMDSGESMQQMTQFSMVEQITNMASQSAKIAESLNASSAVGLIGRTVTYLDADKVQQTGKVESVTTLGGKSTLTVAGLPGVDPTSITQVA